MSLLCWNEGSRRHIAAHTSVNCLISTLMYGFVGSSLPSSAWTMSRSSTSQVIIVVCLVVGYKCKQFEVWKRETQQKNAKCLMYVLQTVHSHTHEEENFNFSQLISKLFMNKSPYGVRNSLCDTFQCCCCCETDSIFTRMSPASACDSNLSPSIIAAAGVCHCSPVPRSNRSIASSPFHLANGLIDATRQRLDFRIDATEHAEDDGSDDIDVLQELASS